MQEAAEKGFENAVMLDQDGNVAEFASANLFAVIDDEIVTPKHNGTFLNGVTRKRMLKLATSIGLTVNERLIEPSELEKASEIFNTGNFGKLMYVNKYENRTLPKGPIYNMFRETYWDYALSMQLGH
jgi:branched-chain amino acid aminotransferase